MGILDAPPRLRAKGFTTTGPFYPTAPGANIVRGIDETDDRLFAINSSNQLVMSTDRGATWGTSKGLPTNVSGATVSRVYRWGAYLYLIGFDTVASTVNVYRALPAPVLNDAFTWSASLLTLTAGSTTSFAKQIGASATAMVVADYGPDPTGGPSMWRTTDGTTWTKVLGPIAATRHIHHVYADPYKTNHWWMTCGDGTGHQYYRSTDDGVTWSKLSTSSGSTADLTAAAWQAVQISADADALYFCGDSGYYTVLKMRRSDIAQGTYKPIISPSFHQQVYIPNGRPARGPFADLVITSGSKTVTSATAAFTADDVGRFVGFTASINPGGYPSPLRPYIQAVTNSTTATLSLQANSSASSVGFILGGETLYAGAFYGCVDTTTGIVYQLANDATSAGTRCGLFATLPDGRCLLLESWGPSYSAEVFIYQGYVYCGRMKRPLLTLDYW